MKKIYIPSNLNLSATLDPEYTSNKNLDRLHYIIHLIYEQRILYKVPQEYVPLKAMYLRNIIVRNYNDYIKVLIDKKIIECDKHYVKGEKSLGYKLAAPYNDVKHKEIELLTKCIHRNLENWKKRRLPTTDIHLYLYNMLQKIDINYDEASNYVDNLEANEYNSAKIAIDKFRNKDFFIYTDDYGRVHTNITNLKSTLRKFLSYNNQKLVNVDIVNSQPLLLIPSLFPSSIRCTFSIYFESSENIEMDFVRYRHLVEEGKLYDYMMEQAGETDRGVFKEKFFRETFFGKKTSKLFCDLFPTVAGEIVKIKKEDYRKLAWLMQRTESKLMITKICGRLMEECRSDNFFITTIHDSILTTQGNVSKIKRVMSEEFGKYGLSPTIRVEPA